MKMAHNRVQIGNALRSVPILWLLGHVMTELGTTSSILKADNARHLSTVGAVEMKIISLPTWTVYMHATLTVSPIMFTSLDQLFTFLTFTLSAGVCLSERYEGEQCNDQDDSEARNEYYYYDSDDGECKTMMAYQCGEARNKNHFPNLMACLNACDPTSK